MEDNKEVIGIDIFNWANQIEAVKKQVDLEIYLTNKHFSLFRLNLDQELDHQARTIFLYEIINFINKGVETGLTVEEFEKLEHADNVVLTTTVGKAERASYLMDFARNRQAEIVDFHQDEHDFRLMRAIVVKCSLKDNDNIKDFYIIKQITPSQAVFGSTAWQLNGNKAKNLVEDVALKLPLDNQILIIDNQIFIFNSSKFERLFNYDYKKLLIAEEKIRAIEGRFKLSFPDGLSLQSLIQDSKKLLTKLQKLEMTSATQEELIKYADEMELELMTDDNDAIIILDAKDLDMFMSLLNDDYMISPVTNKRYEIAKKKALSEPEGEPPRG